MFEYANTSLTEIPNEITLVIYTGGCNLKCPWCFNKKLLDIKPLKYKQIKNTIDNHLGFITGVCFSGGEPLCNPSLRKAISYASECGLKTKINTNGLVPNTCRDNRSLPFVDYMNISLKGFPCDYFVRDCSDWNLIPRADVLEYSFVYTPSLHSDLWMNKFYRFLKSQISQNWNCLFSDRWSSPDIFTLVQYQDNGDLGYVIPDKDMLMRWVEVFNDIPDKKVMIETKEYGREIVYEK